MNGCSLGVRRVLAIDPTSKGFGFAVFEGPDALVDWGVKHARGNGKCFQEAAALIGRYQPEVLVVERTDAAGCLRRLRARQLIEDLLALASDRQLRARRISRQTMLRYFSRSGFATKRQVAVALSTRFPELEPYLPPERKPWMSEDDRMGIFDAIAFAVTSFERRHRPESPLAVLPASAPTTLTDAQ
jgi:hypothetical protein